MRGGYLGFGLNTFDIFFAAFGHFFCYIRFFLKLDSFSELIFKNYLKETLLIFGSISIFFIVLFAFVIFAYKMNLVNFSHVLYFSQ